MKTVITIEDGKVTVQVDDGQPTTVVEAAPVKTRPIVPTTPAPDEVEDRPARPPEPKPPTLVTRRVVLPPATPYASCANCGKQFVRKGRGRRPRLCPNCRDMALAAPNAVRTFAPERPTLKHLSDDNSNVPEGDEQWCLKCRAFTDHDEANHPDDLPPVEPKATELDPGAPPVDDNRPPVKVVSETGKFLDPWDCGTCRELGRLCPLHKFMTDDGQKPPIGSGLPQ